MIARSLALSGSPSAPLARTTARRLAATPRPSPTCAPTGKPAPPRPSSPLASRTGIRPASAASGAGRVDVHGRRGSRRRQPSGGPARSRCGINVRSSVSGRRGSRARRRRATSRSELRIEPPTRQAPQESAATADAARAGSQHPRREGVAACGQAVEHGHRPRGPCEPVDGAPETVADPVADRLVMITAMSRSTEMTPERDRHRPIARRRAARRPRGHRAT